MGVELETWTRDHVLRKRDELVLFVGGYHAAWQCLHLGPDGSWEVLESWRLGLQILGTGATHDPFPSFFDLRTIIDCTSSILNSAGYKSTAVRMSEPDSSNF